MNLAVRLCLFFCILSAFAFSSLFQLIDHFPTLSLAYLAMSRQPQSFISFSLLLSPLTRIVRFIYV